MILYIKLNIPKNSCSINNFLYTLYSQISFMPLQHSYITMARNAKNLTLVPIQNNIHHATWLVLPYFLNLSFPICFLMSQPSLGPDLHDLHQFLSPWTVCLPCLMISGGMLLSTLTQVLYLSTNLMYFTWVFSLSYFLLLLQWYIVIFTPLR